MRPETAGNQQLIKDINRMALVRCLCAKPGLSRADLAVRVTQFGVDAIAIGAAALARYHLTRPIIRTISVAPLTAGQLQTEQGAN